MLNKFSITVGSLFAGLVIACSGSGASDVAGGTIDPNTVAENNSSSDAADIKSSNSADVVLSSSEKKVLSSSSSRDANDGSHTIKIESSSSKKEDAKSSSSDRSAMESSSSCENCGNGIDPIPVSSSSELRDGDIAHASGFSIQCAEDVIYVKLDTPAAASDVGGPEAFKHVEGDSVKFVLQNVYFAIPCEEDAQKQFLQGVNEGHPVVSSEGDTLYVAFSRSKGWEYGCGCAAKATFTLDKAYSGINYTVFDQKEILPVQEN